MLRRSLFALCLIPAALIACSSDDDPPANTLQVTGPLVRGRVTAAGGAPLSGVTVKAGSASATTDAQGVYSLKLAAGGSSVLHFVKPGFMDGIERLDVGATYSTQLDAILLQAPAPQPLDAAVGGTIETTRGSKVVVPANALVTASGAPVTGTVQVSLTPIDPSNNDEVRAAPGDFNALQQGAPTMLESFGMVDITIRDEAGEKLQVATGQNLELRIPAPASVANPPATMPLWSFDETTGQWKDEGVATYDAATRTYVGQAPHMSMWNCDQPYLATCVSGTVVDVSGGAVLPGSRIVSTGVSYLGTSEATADDQGRFRIAVRKDSDVLIGAYHKSGGGTSKAIKSGGADTTVPVAPGEERCVDIGTIPVEKDVFTTSTGGKVTCDQANAVFSGGCAAKLGEAIGGCYNPAGACTIKFSGSQFEISYANGAKVTTSGEGGSSQYIGSNGQVCMTTELASANPDGTISATYRLPSGESYQFSSGADGSYVFTCPNGEKTVVTAEQQQALQACTSADTSGGSSASGESCTIEGLPGQCQNDASCATSGEVCCDFSGAKMCMAKADCDQIKQGQQQ